MSSRWFLIPLLARVYCEHAAHASCWLTSQTRLALCSVFGAVAWRVAAALHKPSNVPDVRQRCARRHHHFRVLPETFCNASQCRLTLCLVFGTLAVDAVVGAQCRVLHAACVWCRITNAGLPTGLARLPYLKSIGLKRNCLTSVPRMLGHMHSLQEIYLEDNNELEVL